MESKPNTDNIDDLKKEIYKLKTDHEEFIRSQLILNSCESMDTNDGLSNNLSEKIDSCLLISEFKNHSFHIGKNRDLPILGLSLKDFEENYLTSEEIILIKSIIKKKLIKLCLSYKKNINIIKSGGLLSQINLKNSVAQHILNNDDLDILKDYPKMFKLVDEYCDLKLEMNELIKEILDHHIFIDNLLLEYKSVLLDNSKSIVLKAKRFKYEIEQMIIGINNKTFDALFLFVNELKKKNESMSLEYQELKMLQRTYSNLEEETDFKNILKKYKILKKQILHYEFSQKVLEEMI